MARRNPFREAPNKCERCNRSVGQNYYSDRRVDTLPGWGCLGLVLCKGCAGVVDKLGDAEARKAIEEGPKKRAVPSAPRPVREKTTGTCQGCLGQHKVNLNGKVARHGWVAPYGTHKGRCGGADHKPLEVEQGYALDRAADAETAAKHWDAEEARHAGRDREEARRAAVFARDAALRYRDAVARILMRGKRA